MPPESPHRRETEREKARDQLIRQFIRSPEGTVALVFLGISTYTAFATFGIEWARLAGSSAWEAAVWPVALTATTVQGLYCWLRTSPLWHPNWVSGLCGTVAAGGYVLAFLGNTLYLDHTVHQLHPAAETAVRSAPGFCLSLSVVMAMSFIATVRPDRSDRFRRIPIRPVGKPGAPDRGAAEEPEPWWKQYEDPATSPEPATGPATSAPDETADDGPGRP